MSSYQDRRDIDRLYRELYTKTGSLNVVKFDEDSPLLKLEIDNVGTIDGILSYYQLIGLNERVTELERKIMELEQNQE